MRKPKTPPPVAPPDPRDHLASIRHTYDQVEQQRAICRELRDDFKTASAELRRREKHLNHVIGDDFPLFEQPAHPADHPSPDRKGGVRPDRAVEPSGPHS